MQVDWNFRKDHSRTRNQVYVTIDGTDFRILEPRPFSRSWFSHKFKGPGVRYEIGVSIATGWIVWVNGPYRCGTWPDEKIAQDGLHHILEDGERYIADGGYKSRLALVPDDTTTQQECNYIQIYRTRHETINHWFKKFKVIGDRFNGEVEKHGIFTHAVVNIVQLGIMVEEINPFDVSNYFDEPVTWPSSW